MTTPTNIIRDLRALMPPRRLSYADATTIAERQANGLRELLGLADTPELPLGTIEALPRIEVRRRYDLPVSGLTHWHNGRWLILLNGDEPETRQRFSLAHELKHVIDHSSRDYTCWDDRMQTANQKGERLADYFAACLLMPKRHVKSLWGKYRNVQVLADRFSVSSAAMSVRLSQLGLLDSRQRCSTAPAAWRPFSRRYYRPRNGLLT